MEHVYVSIYRSLLLGFCLCVFCFYLFSYFFEGGVWVLFEMNLITLIIFLAEHWHTCMHGFIS